MTPETAKKIRRFAVKLIRDVDRNYTIEWMGKHRPVSFTWSGDGVLRMSERNPVRALHDVAHVMIASPRRRHLPEFGLGSDPMNSVREPLMFVTPRYAQYEEELTCDLQWALAAYIAGPKAAKHVEDYVFIDDPPDPRAIRRMADRHSLPENFVKKVLRVRKERLKTLPMERMRARLARFRYR